jgi:hypothetical protein
MEGSSQISVILSASVYAAVSVVMLVWAWFHLERRQEVARRTERIQQLVVVLHFVILAGWILRHRIGLSERDADPTFSSMPGSPGTGSSSLMGSLPWFTADFLEPLRSDGPKPSASCRNSRR